MKLLISIINGLTEGLPQLIAMLPMIITTIITTLLEHLPELIQAGITLLLALVKALPQIIQGIVAAIPQIIDAVLSSIIDALPLLIQAGIELFIALIAALPEIIESIVQAAPQIVDALVSAFGKLDDKLIDIGKNLVLGIWDGIQSAADWFYSQVMNFFSSIVDSVKSTLGIHSPSTVFAEIGENMALGLGQGFTNSMSRISDAIQNSIPSSFNDLGIRVNGSYYADKGLADGYGSQTNNNYSTSSDSSIHVGSVSMYPATGSDAMKIFKALSYLKK